MFLCKYEELSMTISQRLDKIQMLLKTADESMLEKIESMLEKSNSASDGSVLTKAQKMELDARRERHLKGDSPSSTWNEVKQELIDKYGLPA